MSLPAVSFPGVADRARRVASWVTAGPRRLPAIWAAATLALLLALSGGPGISRDEAAVLDAADASLAAPGAPSTAGPPLAPAAARVVRAALTPLGVSRVRAARVPTAVAGAALSALLSAAAWELSGPAAALLAPALFWAAPRHLQAGLGATPDVALAALALALALAWRRAAGGEDRRVRLRAAAFAGLFLGIALAARTDAWVLAAALALHAALAGPLRAVPPGGARSALTSLCVTVILGALVLVALWPSLLWSQAARAAALAVPGRAAAARAQGVAGTGLAGLAFPLLVTALTLPATLLVVCGGGLAHAAARLSRAVRSGTHRAAASDELLLLLLAAAPVLAAATGVASGAGGVRAWLPAMPFLALLGARALVRAAVTAWPARAAPLAASLALLALWPAIRATGHFHPSGSSGWNELAGGAPGAASLGLPRQEGGEAATRLLDAVNARAGEGARIWWPSSPAALRALARDGRLRSDLVLAAGPDDADVAVVALDGAGRDAEYQVWTSFRSARPTAGAYLDEVPLAFVYARPGAWR